ncbi:MAG: hypothetical protein GXO47_14400 [Chlorobi bacterium]|nr:hypothetical protein [Chlorobiota bacterium]
MKLSETDKVFYNDGYKLGLQAAENNLTKEAIYAAAENMYKAIDGLIESLLSFASRENINVDCKKGCSFCCHQPIYAVSHEIDYLNNYISNNLTQQEQDKIISKAEKLQVERSKLNKQELQYHKGACPLLNDDGSCLAYPARPMACRIYLSRSEHSCRLFYEDPKPDNHYAQLFEFPLQAGRMMNEGFTKALKSAGLNSGEFRIEEGLTIIWKQKNE